MQIKLFEVRDRATFIPCFGILMAPTRTIGAGPFCDRTYRECDAEEFLLSRAGYGFEYPLVLFGRLEDGECQHDPYNWRGSARTMPEAHRHVSLHWNELSSGDVIDVEFILGEKATPKVSERLR